MDNLYNKLSCCGLAGGESNINEYLSRNTNDGFQYHLSDRVKRSEEYATDSYKIEWHDTGLDNDDQRILQKILRKDFRDCGRKRGAILRYIKHFKKEPDLTGQKLYQTCQNQSSTH